MDNLEIYVVSLARACERRQAITERLNKEAIPFRLFEAVDGACGEHIKYHPHTQAPSLRGYALTPGEVGCFASHYEIWRSCLSRNKAVLVLEDDVDWVPGFKGLIQQFDACLPRFHYVRLAGLISRVGRPIGDYRGWGIVQYRRNPLGTQAYFLTPVGARALLRHVAHWREPVDDFMGRSWLHGLPIGI